MDGLEIFFNLDQGILVFEVRERESKLLLILFFVFSEPFSCPFDRVALSVKEPLDL